MGSLGGQKHRAGQQCILRDFFQRFFQKSFFPQVIPQSRVPEVFVVGKLIMFNSRVFPSREYHLNNYPVQSRGISPDTTAELVKISMFRKIEQDNCLLFNILIKKAQFYLQ